MKLILFKLPNIFKNPNRFDRNLSHYITHLTAFFCKHNIISPRKTATCVWQKEPPAFVCKSGFVFDPRAAPSHANEVDVFVLTPGPCLQELIVLGERICKYVRGIISGKHGKREEHGGSRINHDLIWSEGNEWKEEKDA